MACEICGKTVKVLFHLCVLFHHAHSSWVASGPSVASGLNVNHDRYIRNGEDAKDSAHTSSSPAAADEQQSAPNPMARRAASVDILPTINLVEETKVLQQGVTSEFLLIALGRLTATQTFETSLASIDANLADLVNGSTARNIIPPPTAEVIYELALIGTQWSRLRTVLLANVATVNTESEAVLNSTEIETDLLMGSLSTLYALYNSYGSLVGSQESAQTHYAFTLRLLGESMAKQCLFLIIGVQREKYLAELPLSEQKFVSIIDSLVWGNLVLEIPRLSDVCALHSMFAVASSWYQFYRTLQDIRSLGGVISESLLDAFVSQFMQLIRFDLVEMMMHFEGTASSCAITAAFGEDDWSIGIKMESRLRTLVQSAARIFFEVQKDGVTEYNRLVLMQALFDVQTAVRNCYAGSYTDSLQPPPTEELRSRMAEVYDDWQILSAVVERTLSTGAADTIQNYTLIINNVAERSRQLDSKLQNYAKLFVFEAVTANPSMRSIVWQLAEEQRVLVEMLAKESIVISLSDTAKNKTGFFEAATALFKANHDELLYGAANSSLVPEVSVPRTTDACTLTQMSKISVDFEALHNILVQLYGSKDFLTDHLGFIAAEAANPVLAEAFLAFKQGWDSFRETDELRLQDLQIAYIYSNPNAIGSKDNLDYASGPESYHTAHKNYHPTYRTILYARNYYDIFIFDLEGNLIYSVYKELDYATNFMANGTGEWKDSGLGEAFRAAVVNPLEINVIDWKPYGPSYGALASFLSTGILQDGELLGVFCTQMPPESKPVEISEMEPVLEAARRTVSVATGYYEAGSGTCSPTYSPAEWEISLEKLSRMEYRFLKTETEYALLANGYSQTWLNISEQGLEEQNRFTETESSKLELVEAMYSFKQAWDSFRETNAERLLSLQIAYILLNPYPTGSKDQLDAADGPEEYHQVHRKYHPVYRAILYERNYYDIFFLDMGGNCIYSVYKELDYATNFLADGPGEWKDSGLGEAFRAAMRNPDGINVIDWKPYGPSYGALASFLSTGIRRFGELIGVFCTQLPPEFTPRNSTALLHDTMEEMSSVFRKFMYGVPSENIYPPSAQYMSWRLFNASDLWLQLSKYPAAMPTEQGLDVILSVGAEFVVEAKALNQDLLERAYQAAPSIYGARLQLAVRQMTLLQTMQRDCVLMAIGGYDYLRSQFIVMTQELEDNNKLLINGNQGRRLSAASRSLAIMAIPETRDPAAEALLLSAESAWATVKPVMESFIDSQTATTEDLKTVVEGMDAAIDAAIDSADFFSTVTRTTTMLTLEILAPMPLTGSWTGGQTFRLAARLAEGIINEEQLLLPGYQIRHAIFDDKCDPSVGSDVVVSANAEKNTYVAIAGMGCDSVCRQVSSLAVSMRLSFLSYECSAEDLSDTNTYPAAARLGTVTTPMIDVIKVLRTKHGWDHIYVVSGDPAKYEAESEGLATSFRNVGLTAQYLNANEARWGEITGVMDTIKGATKGKDRVLFIVGSETFFRKLICASITQGLQKGIVWLSRGTWRSEWWKKSDLLTSSHRQWLREDVSGRTLRDAFADFKAAWDSFSDSVVTTRERLFEMYVTDEKDNLDFAEGPQKYHSVHQALHPTYRTKLYARGYYDIFMFDLNGDLIYSVFKETDYATNFELEGDGAWKDSGLGQAYRAAVADPDNISYIDWQPYGPSAYADAAFLSTGLRDEDGVLIGVYCIQLPPEYERSIEAIQPQCSFNAITQAFQGSINVGGLGEPTADLLEKPLSCFKGYSAVSFMSLIDRRFETGYPVGDLPTQVRDPYFEIKAHAVDGACALAFAIQHLLQQGYTVQQVQQPTTEVYERMSQFIRTEMDFLGVSGRVKFSGNDKDGLLAIRQVQDGLYTRVGIVDSNRTITWQNNGSVAIYWEMEPVETFELMWILHPIAISFAVCCPCLIGCWAGYRLRASWRQQQLSNQQ